MPQWPVFGWIAVVLTVAFVWLARASARTIRAGLDARADPDAPPHPAASVLESDRLLVGNVVTTHGLLLVVLASMVWFTGVPIAALGVGVPTGQTLGLGIGLGLALAVGNGASARLAERVGFERDERLRALLAPESASGWAGLLLVVLPLVAGAEELLFRAVFVGGLTAGFGWPIWGLAVISSVAFGLGHGLQGEAGVIVTTGLGFALAAAYVLTGSLAVVVVAHYLVNAVEFVANEGLRSG